MPIAALASSPVERSVKNFVGSRSSRSQTAGWSVASIRPSIRSMVRFCSSMKAAATTLVTITARQTCTIRLGLRPSARTRRAPCRSRSGTSAPSATVTSPLSSRFAQVAAGAAQAEPQQPPAGSAAARAAGGRTSPRAARTPPRCPCSIGVSRPGGRDARPRSRRAATAAPPARPDRARWPTSGPTLSRHQRPSSRTARVRTREASGDPLDRVEAVARRRRSAAARRA